MGFMEGGKGVEVGEEGAVGGMEGVVESSMSYSTSSSPSKVSRNEDGE